MLVELVHRKSGCNRICGDIEERFYSVNLGRESAGIVSTVRERGLDWDRETLDIEATPSRRETRRSRNYKLDIVVVRLIIIEFDELGCCAIGCSALY